MNPTIHLIVERIVREDPRYPEKAYHFVLSALHRVISGLGEPRHISGAELSHGVRDLAIAEYGPLARTVLGHWNIVATEDIGEIVFNLLDRGILARTEEDSKADFAGVFDFDEAFEGTSPGTKDSGKRGGEE